MIQLIVKNDQGQVNGVKPQITSRDIQTVRRDDFEYLYNANYIPQTQKLLNAKQAK